MSNEILAIILQHDFEDKFDNISSDIELVNTAKKLSIKHFKVSNTDASSIGREVLKLYGEVR